MARPHLGRAGAGALLVIACMMVVQAINSGATSTSTAQVGSLAARARAVTTEYVGSRLSAGVAGVAQPPQLMPPPQAPREVVPVGRPSIQVPILMYHYIRVNPVPGDRLGFNLSVTPDDFNRQLDWLAANGYHPVDFQDLRQYYAGQEPLPAKPIVLTFDDGYRDMYTNAYPALRAHHFKAVSYVVTGFAGGPNYMTWDMIRELEANGIEIGAHTYSHLDLTKVSPDELHRQLVDSEGDFLAQLGHPVVDFCYPAGRFNAGVVAAVQAAGYQTATTTDPGTQHALGDRFTWSRVRVSGGEPLDQFVANLGPTEPAVKLPPPPAYLRSLALPRLPLVYAFPRPRLLPPAPDALRLLP